MNIYVYGDVKSSAQSATGTIFCMMLESKRHFKPWRKEIEQYDSFLNAGYERPDLDADIEYKKLLELISNQKKDIRLAELAKKLIDKES